MAAARRISSLGPFSDEIGSYSSSTESVIISDAYFEMSSKFLLNRENPGLTGSRTTEVFPGAGILVGLSEKLSSGSELAGRPSQPACPASMYM